MVFVVFRPEVGKREEGRAGAGRREDRGGRREKGGRRRKETGKGRPYTDTNIGSCPLRATPDKPPSAAAMLWTWVVPTCLSF